MPRSMMVVTAPTASATGPTIAASSWPNVPLMASSVAGMDLSISSWSLRKATLAAVVSTCTPFRVSRRGSYTASVSRRRPFRDSRRDSRAASKPSVGIRGTCALPVAPPGASAVSALRPGSLRPARPWRRPARLSRRGASGALIFSTAWATILCARSKSAPRRGVSTTNFIRNSSFAIVAPARGASACARSFRSPGALDALVLSTRTTAGLITH